MGHPQSMQHQLRSGFGLGILPTRSIWRLRRGICWKLRDGSRVMNWCAWMGSGFWLLTGSWGKRRNLKARCGQRWKSWRGSMRWSAGNGLEERWRVPSTEALAVSELNLNFDHHGHGFSVARGG